MPVPKWGNNETSRTPPGVRELKLLTEFLIAESYRRTPPGVRELKLSSPASPEPLFCRTPPGVRELKPESTDTSVQEVAVAPLPGCVN